MVRMLAKVVEYDAAHWRKLKSSKFKFKFKSKSKSLNIQIQSSIHSLQLILPSFLPSFLKSISINYLTQK